MGVLLGFHIANAKPHGSRVYDLKPFYRGAKVTVIDGKPKTSLSSNDFEWLDGWKCL